MARLADGSQQTNTNGTDKPDPEVVAKPKRRRFTAKYKLRILRDADALGDDGKVGEMLRREGLYYSYLSAWRRERERAEPDGLKPKKRGRKPSPGKGAAKEAQRLARENERLKRQLAQAEAIIEMITAGGGCSDRDVLTRRADDAADTDSITPGCVGCPRKRDILNRLELPIRCDDGVSSSTKACHGRTT